MAMTVVGFVLLIACANVAGLLLARACVRRKELAIRMSLGASRSRIIRQLLTEGLVIAVLGGGLGLALAYAGINVVRAGIGFNEAVRDIPIRLDVNVLVYALLLSLASAVLCSLAPALAASHDDINSSLKDEGRAASAGRSQGRLRRILVTAEVTLALVLLIGTSLLLRALYLIEHQNLGFASENLLTAGVNLDKARYKEALQQTQFVEKLISRLEQIPGANGAAATSDLPANGPGSISFRIQGDAELANGQKKSARDTVATPGFFSTAGIPLLRGRVFTEHDDAVGRRVVIVNQEFVRRYFANQEPLGKQIHLDLGGPANEWYEVIGVVGNVKTIFMDTRDDPSMYECFLQRPMPTFSLMVRTKADPDSLVSAVRGSVAEIDQELPLARVMTFTAVMDEQQGGSNFFVSMLATFSLLALVLAGIGIYGLISYSVGQRTHEIAIRMALGAKGKEVRGMVLKEGLKTTLIGGAIGLLMALPLPKLYAAMFENLQAWDPWAYCIVSVAMVAVAIVATYIPARRASRIDPMQALRSN